ncbi:MAG: response regulator [Deltaproteobacteria bacterium]|nr:response regulator [Deltaproteobacteria bacterium]
MIEIEEMTVMIADDAVPMCKSIHNMMKVIRYGKDFLFANNGKEVLGILQKKHVDILLLDYNMPEMNGGETLSHIRADRKLRDLPVIMVTAEAYKDFVAEVGESEVDAYILKPITIKLLQDKISFVVEKANNPPPMIYHLKRARDFEEKGDIDAAISEAELAMEANPEVTRPIRELGYFYFKKNDLKEAEKWLLKAAVMNYLDVFAFHYLGEIYLKLNKIEKASHYFEKAMKISPRHISRGINFGKTLVQMKMSAKAIQVFNKTLELSGSTIELREEIADFCMEEGVDEYAVKLLESIVKELPDRSDLFFKLGKIMEKLGDINKAVAYLVNAAGIDKENVDIKISLAKNYLTLGKPILAEKPLKDIIKISPKNELAQELLRQCA